MSYSIGNNNYDSPFVAKPTIVTGLDTPPFFPPNPPPNNSATFPLSRNVERTIAEVASFDFLSYTYNLARIVKFIAAVDIFFAFLYVLSMPYIFLYSFVNLIMGTIGYRGASKYRKKWVLSYGIYCAVKIAGNIALVIMVSIQNQNSETPSSIRGFVLLNSFIVLFEIYLTFIVFRLYKTLKKATAYQLIELNNGPRAVRMVLW